MTKANTYVYPTLAFVLAVICWYGATTIFAIPPYIIPAPQNVLFRIIEDYDILVPHVIFTFSVAVIGFLLSAIIGIFLAMILVMSRTLEKMVMPWLILSQTFPKVALAPLIAIWFGLGFLPKVGVTVMVAFFPVLISSAVGLRSVDSDMLDLAKAIKANRRQVFTYFRMPTALPHIFGGLKVSVAFAMVGAVIAEWVGATQGLGYLLIQANAMLDTTLLFSVLIILMIMGIVLYYIVEVLERRAIPWHVTVRMQDRV